MDHRFKEYDWLTVMELLVVARDEWRCNTMGSGGQFVIMAGTLLKLELPAGENLSRVYFPFHCFSYHCRYLLLRGILA